MNPQSLHRIKKEPFKITQKDETYPSLNTESEKKNSNSFQSVCSSLSAAGISVNLTKGVLQTVPVCLVVLSIEVLDCP